MGLCLFLYVSGNVAHGETSDHVIESRASNVTYSAVRGCTWRHPIRWRFDQSTSNLSRSSGSYNSGDWMRPMDTWIHRDRLMKIKRTQWSDTFSSRMVWQNLYASSQIGRMRLNDFNSSNNVQSQPLIRSHRRIWRLRPISSINWDVLCDEKPF